MKNVIYILSAAFLFKCGVIKKCKEENFKPLTNAKQIEGTYKNYENDSLKLHHLSLNGQINWHKKHIDSIKFTSVKIEVRFS